MNMTARGVSPGEDRVWRPERGLIDGWGGKGSGFFWCWGWSWVGTKGKVFLGGNRCLIRSSWIEVRNFCLSYVEYFLVSNFSLV